MLHSQFIQLMRIALGNADGFDMPPTKKEWEELLNLSAKQSVTGIVAEGLNNIRGEQKPDIDILLELANIRNIMMQENRKLNSFCNKICEIFQQENINVCVLKGQGMSLLYPNPLMRSGGDIDVWMEGGRDRVIEYVQSNLPKAKKPSEHHISVTLRENVEMEVHYIPAELYNPKNYRKLKAWCKNMEPKQWNNKKPLPEGAGFINVPTDEFNMVFIPTHMYYHWAFEGCGMKQLLDYYYVLETCSMTADERKRAYDTLCSFGIGPFIAAVMYIFQQFGMKREIMICEPNKKYGKKLMEEILEVGTVSADELLSGKYGKENKVHKILRRLWRWTVMLPLAPTELPWVAWGNFIYALER